MTIKGETWSRGTYSRLAFGVSVNLHLSMVELPSAMKLVCSLLHPTYE